MTTSLRTSSSPPTRSLAVTPKRPRGRPRKTADERDEGNRRGALITAAARLFRRKGFAATTTRDIAAAVGMHAGSPFYHFASKEALLQAVMVEGMRGALERQDAVLLNAADPTASLRQLIRNHFGVLLGPGSDFIPVMLYEGRSLNARQRASVNRLQAKYESAWVPVLQALMAAGRMRGDLHLARLLIFGALNWSAQWYRARKPATLDDLTDAAIALFIHPEPA